MPFSRFSPTGTSWQFNTRESVHRSCLSAVRVCRFALAGTRALAHVWLELAQNSEHFSLHVLHLFPNPYLFANRTSRSFLTLSSACSHLISLPEPCTPLWRCHYDVQMREYLELIQLPTLQFSSRINCPVAPAFFNIRLKFSLWILEAMQK